LKKEVKKTNSGVRYFEVDIDEMILKLKGMGICDSCSQAVSAKGYLVPVLNYVYCQDCFDKSTIHKIYYEEDRSYEDKKTEQYKTILES
jgi:hypothetical protein